MTLDFPSLLTFPNESGLALRGWVCARTGHSALLFRWWFAPQIRPQPIQSTVFISHLTNSYGCGNLQAKVLLTVAPFRPSLPPQPRVSSRNQPLLASSAPRSVNIFSILRRLHILPVATGVYVLPLQSSRFSDVQPFDIQTWRQTHCPFVFSGLQTLFLSLRSFSHPDPLFSTTSALFLQNTRGGIPLRKLARCTEAQKCLSVSPLFATLTHSVSRKSFPCHSYENIRDGGVTSTAKLWSVNGGPQNAS